MLGACTETRQRWDSGQAPCLGTEGSKWPALTAEDGPRGPSHNSLWQGSSVMAEFPLPEFEFTAN